MIGEYESCCAVRRYVGTTYTKQQKRKHKYYGPMIHFMSKIYA